MSGLNTQELFGECDYPMPKSQNHLSKDLCESFWLAYYPMISHFFNTQKVLCNWSIGFLGYVRVNLIKSSYG